MQFIVYFDYAAVVLGILLIIFCYPKMSVSNATNRMYKIILIVEVIAAALDIFTVFQYGRAYDFSLGALYFTNALYLIVWQTLPIVLVMYTKSFLKLTEYSEKQKALQRTVTAIPYVSVALMIATSPWSKAIFYFSENREYTHGKLHIVSYIISALYMVLTIVIATRHAKEVGKRRLRAIHFFTMMIILGIIIETNLNGIIILHFLSVCASLIMYLALQSPEANIDTQTGLYNREAFISALSDQVRHDTPFTIVSVVPDNIKSVGTVVGLETYNLFMKQFGEYIEHEFVTPAYLVGDASVAFIADDNHDADEGIDNIRKRFSKPWNVGGVWITRSCSISSVAYPLVASDTEGLLDAVNCSVNDLKKNANGIVIKVTEPPRGGLKLDELEKQKLILEEESREANEARAKAEKADREKSMFLANMSHEIRTPMNAILGMTELILRDDINERVRQNAMDIRGAGDSLLSIINDILDISKVESGKMTLVNEDYDVRRMLQDIVTLVSTRIPANRVAFNINISRNLPETLCGDVVRVRQIFINVLNNAAKFTTDGSITFAVDGDVVGTKYILRASITDTGCGIRPEDKAKLFESFSRIEDSRNHYVEGTGLGLPLCKKLLACMDGDIEVESEFGKGSTFEISIPQTISGQRTIGDVLKDKKQFILIITDGMKQATQPDVKALCDALDCIEADYRVCCSSKDVESSMVGRRITHVFTYRGLYEDYADWLRDYCNPEIILFGEENLKYDDLNDVFVLHPPIYSLSVMRLLEKDFKKENSTHDRFKAPKAVVLVVDDNPVNVKVIEGMLKCYDIIADSVLSGPEAIERSARKQYDMIFMDHMMPKMDGVEATHNIRSMGGHNTDVPIIALTANAVYGVRNMFLAEGFTEYLSKPIDMKRLAACLRKYLPAGKLVFEDFGVAVQAEAAEMTEAANATEATETAAATDVTEVQNDAEDAALQDENGATMITDNADDADVSVKAEPQEASRPIKLTGVNVGLGIDNCGGRRERYNELLDTFYRDVVIQRDQMTKLIESNNSHSLKIEAHTMRILAGSIGATEIAELAGKLEKAAAEDEHETKLVFEELREKIDTLAAELEHYFAAGGAT